MQSPTKHSVPSQEVDRRLREYREQAFQQQVMPHIVYHPPFIVCPWQGCGYSIAGVDFQLELMGDQSLYQRLLRAWWKGPGLVGRCPECKKHVLFTMQDKQCVADPANFGASLLPDDWQEHAYFIA